MKSSTYTINGMKYKVTNAKIDGKGTVELVSIPSNSKVILEVKHLENCLCEESCNWKIYNKDWTRKLLWM